MVRRRLATQAYAIESAKGCSPFFSAHPVPLTPPLAALGRPGDMVSAPPCEPHLTLGGDSAQTLPGHRVWFNLAVHPDHPPRAREYESFLRIMSGVQNGFIFEATGNNSRVELRIGLHEPDTATLKAALSALNMTLGEGHPQQPRFGGRFPGWGDTPVVAEFVPRPPYADAFTRLDELPHPPVGLIVKALHDIPDESLGLYQVCVKAVRDDRWAQNAQLLHDARFRTRLEPGAPEGTPSLNWNQQVPSGNLSRLSQDTYVKTHADRAFFFALGRVAMWPGHIDTERNGPTAVDHDAARAQLQHLAAPLNLIRQGGRPLDLISTPEAFPGTPLEKRRRSLVTMLEQGQVYRHGVLMNSEELAAWIHLPPLEVIESLRLDHLRREPLLQTQPTNQSPLSGTRLGVSIDGDQHTPAFVSSDHRSRHTSIVGKNGTGKSTLVQSMLLDDARRGEGMFVIDPHGQLVRDLADRLPAEAALRTRWLDFEDPDHAVLFNPLRAGGDNQPPTRVADHFIGAFRVMTGGWGDRLEHILRHLIIAAVMMPGGSLLDVVTALERDNDRGDETRRRMMDSCTDTFVLRFLKQFKKTYKNPDTNPVHHKLSKLLLSGPASLTLRQPHNRLDIPAWMGRGDIVLIDLGPVSGEFKQLLGSFLIASAYSAALARKAPRGGRLRPFHVVADEAHRFSDALLSGMIAETRKFRVGLTIAHQYLHQFSTDTVHALGTVGTSVVFNVDSGDAEVLSRTLRKRVDAEQITALNDFEAYARIGTEPVHLHTPHFRDLPEGDGCFEEIRERSYRDWYVPRRKLEAQVNETIRTGTPGISTPGTDTLGSVPAPGNKAEGLPNDPSNNAVPNSSGGRSNPPAPTFPEETLPDDPDWPQPAASNDPG